MGLGDLLNALGQGQQGGQGGQPGAQAGPFGNWTQPTGTGLASGQAPQLPMHNSGLQAILMRLGVFH